MRVVRALTTFTAGLCLTLVGCQATESDDDAAMAGAGTTGSGGTGGSGGTDATGGSGGAAFAGTSAGGTSSAGAGMAGTPAAGTGGSETTAGRSGAGGTTNGTAGKSAAGSGGKAGVGGKAGASGAAGSGGMTPGLEACPEPPDGTPNAAVTAINTENGIRLAMGIDCAVIATGLVTSAQNHCDYYVENKGSADCEADSPHSEIEGCPGFTGAGLGDRFKAAGYQIRQSGSEDMAFLNDPERAVMTFVNSVYHRTPILDPWMRDVGYGGGEGCDTIDFGTGATSASTITAFYPYADQTGLPTSFDGSREGPEPPKPASGWPSGYPVTLYARNFTVSSHEISVEADGTPLAHQWLDSDDPTLTDYAKVLYTDAPMLANTKYHVVITGDLGGTTTTFEWSFTTGAATGGGRP